MDNDSILGWIMILFIVIILYKLYNDSDYFQLKCIVSDVNGKKYKLARYFNFQELILY